MAARKNYDYRKLAAIARKHILGIGRVDYKSLNKALGGVGAGTITKVLHKLARQKIVARTSARRWGPLLNPDGSLKGVSPEAAIEVSALGPAPKPQKRTRRKRSPVSKKPSVTSATLTPQPETATETPVTNAEKYKLLVDLGRLIGGRSGKVLLAAAEDTKEAAVMSRIREAINTK